MKDLKDGKQSRDIMYSYGKRGFGTIIATFTDHGICGVTILASKDSIQEYLKEEYPGANIRRGENPSQYIDEIVGTMSGSDPVFNLDIHGTEFQMKVWDAIREIPYGSVMTYSQIAEKIGRPHAVRAVANACGKNPVPIIIPCHRVIRKSGDLGGYGLGINLKKKLLTHERYVKEKGNMASGNAESAEKIPA
ncbi:MAG: methylated-DNA--[protein]-cysteine S-methyltransferase, partial [Candidatus Thermoplasmatota archaeon]|nr:methylated-DNA--[protein]-cysteine S-methyltransferase [Candidatus Thermoplasmatota archaeon]